MSRLSTSHLQQISINFWAGNKKGATNEKVSWKSKSHEKCTRRSTLRLNPATLGQWQWFLNNSHGTIPLSHPLRISQVIPTHKNYPAYSLSTRKFLTILRGISSAGGRGINCPRPSGAKCPKESCPGCIVQVGIVREGGLPSTLS